MNTKYLTYDLVNEKQNMLEAGEILKRGGLVAFPTETVYGLGGDALNPESSQKIYAAKGRPSDNPLIVHVCRLEDVYPIVRNVSEKAEKAAKTFWPGPLTMICEKSDQVPYESTGGLNTVAIRMTNHPVALQLIEVGGRYIAAPSANVSGKPSPTLAKYVKEDLDGKIEMILDGGSTEIGLESTIVDMTTEPPVILRPGFITQEMLEKVIGEVRIDQAIVEADSKLIPKAPGMKYKHYAPKGELTIIDGEIQKVVQTINCLSNDATANGKKVGVIATDETKSNYIASSIKSVGSRLDENSIARLLYQLLREFDDEEIEVIYSESFSATGRGQAIMNRLLKAAGHKVMFV